MDPSRPPRRFARCTRLALTTPRGRVLEAWVATGPLARLLGLAHLDPGRLTPLLLPDCRAVHGIGMRAELDVCFLAMPSEITGHATVLTVVAPLRRRGSAAIGRALRKGVAGRSVAALELGAGTAAAFGIEPGARLAIGHIGPPRT